MAMVADLVPRLKRFIGWTGLNEVRQAIVLRVVIAFILRSGRMSCFQAAGSIRTQTRHRAQISRCLGRPCWRKIDINFVLRQKLLEQEAEQGLFVFILDATLIGQSGVKTENTYSTGNRKRRPSKGRRFGKYKYAKKSCHCFTTGLLITPSGRRIPFSKPYHTREYCQKKGLKHRTTAEAAADLIRELPLPATAEVIILGDTAYESRVVEDACSDRGYYWIFPCNPERVLSGTQGKRPRVRSLLENWSKWSRQTLRLAPGQGRYAIYRRLSPYRIGPKAKPRTYYVHEEKRTVRSVGEVRLVFSTMKKDLKTATPDDVKILLTNAPHLSKRDVIELYSLRWQIELFFKELKSTLGFHQYQFIKFAAVEVWTQLALTAFLYLEWYRVQQLSNCRLTEEQKHWWRHQRTHGLCKAVCLANQQAELRYIADRLDTPGGIQKLKRELRNGLASEYRAAL